MDAIDISWTRIDQILLSRFIVNLRRVGPSSTASITDQFTSRHSTIAFRVRNLTMNDVVGNLGEVREKTARGAMRQCGGNCQNEFGVLGRVGLHQRLRSLEELYMPGSIVR